MSSILCLIFIIRVCVCGDMLLLYIIVNLIYLDFGLLLRENN